MTFAGATVVISGLLAGAIAYAWLLGRSAAQDPKIVLLNTLLRHAADWR